MDSPTESDPQTTVAHRRFRVLLSYLVAVTFVVVAGIWSARNWDSLADAFNLETRYLLGLGLAVMASLMTTGLLHQVAATPLGARLPFRQWVTIAVASTFANLVLPVRAGIMLRAAYLKRCGKLAIPLFASTMLAIYLITFMVNSAIGLGVLGWLYARNQWISPSLMWAYGIVIAMCSCAFALPFHRWTRTRKWQLGHTFERFHSGWKQLRDSPGLLIRVGLLSAGLTGLYAVRLYLAFAAIGHTAPISSVLLCAVLAVIATFVAITPGGLGIREAVVVGTATITGIETEVALLASVTDRAVSLAIVLFLGPFAMKSIAGQIAPRFQRTD